MRHTNTIQTPGDGITAAPFLNKIQAAELLGIKPRTLDLWMRQRLVPHFKIGRTVRFDAGDIRETLRDRCRVA